MGVYSQWDFEGGELFGVEFVSAFAFEIIFANVSDFAVGAN